VSIVVVQGACGQPSTEEGDFHLLHYWDRKVELYFIPRSTDFIPLMSRFANCRTKRFSKMLTSPSGEDHLIYLHSCTLVF
jgi:hypothetical protein